MKKVLSLLIATALSVTAFASLVSANSITPSNKATLAISCVEIDEEDALEDLTAFVGEAGLTDYSYYQFTVTAGNLPALEKDGTKYTGEGITAVSAKMTITTDAEYESEWFLAAPAGKGSFTPDGDDYVFSYAAANDYKKLLVTEAVAEGGSKDIATYQMVISNDYTYNIVLDSGSNMVAANYSKATSTKGTDPYEITLDGGTNNITVDSTPIVLNSAPAPAATYTVAFKNEDGTATIQSNEYDANATVTAPGVANKAGYTFTGWSESVGGATVTPIATATADKTYYAVYAKDTGVVDPVGGDVATKNIGAVAGFEDLDGNSVESLSKNYGITKFSTTLDLINNDYYLIVEDEDGNIKDENSPAPFKINFGAENIETSGTVSFFALVHSTTHVIKSIVLKAVAK